MIKKIVLSLIILLTSVSGMFAEKKAAAYDCIPNFGNRTLKLTLVKGFPDVYEEAEMIKDYLRYELYAVKSFEKRDEVLFQIGIVQKDEDENDWGFIIYDKGTEGDRTICIKKGLRTMFYWRYNQDIKNEEPLYLNLYPDGKLNYYDTAFSSNLPQTSFYAEKVFSK